ncbi:MAG: hypothetical protein M3O61_03610 [Gemmatimonadota bacterium]|nr:hypothetical protein [Gemmatimonadota bacterium]
MFELAHDRSVDLIEQMHAAEITYSLNAVCEHCGKTSKGPETFGDLLKVVPSPDARLRAAEIPLRYTLGRESIVRLEGFPDAQRAFFTIEQVMRASLSEPVADSLMAQITESLRTM